MSSLVEEDKVMMDGATQPSTHGHGLTKHLKLFLNCTFMVLGGTGAPLLLRLYFVHGGKRMWLSSLLQISGWPFLLIPLSISYLHRRKASHQETRFFTVTPSLIGASAFIGLLTGLDCYLYAYGSSYLPLSTSSLLVSTQLAFTALFALLIVKQRFTPYSINSVVLLTVGAVVLSLHSGGDRPANESSVQYYLGFVMTVGAAVLIGLLLSLIELTYRRTKEKVTYSLVMEMQMVMGIFGTGFCLVGMLVNKDFQAIPREAREFGLGEVKYYMVLVWDTIFWQLVNLGLVGLISGASSLFGGIIVAVVLPISEFLAVIIFHERFDGGKGVALALSLWGFASYLYGEMKHNKKLKQKKEVELSLPIP